MKAKRLRVVVLVSSCLFVASYSFAQSVPDVEEAASGGTPLETTAELPSAPVPNNIQAQSAPTGQTQTQQTTTNQKTPPPSNEPTLGDLGISTTQSQGSAKQQAMMDKRTHMLKVHQTLGLITVAPMVAALITGPMAKSKGPSTNLDVHVALGALTGALYGTSAYYAIAAPKVEGVKPRGAIRLHKALEWVHGPGFLLTGIAGIDAYKQENAREKIHGFASWHAPLAYTSAIAYGVAIVSVSWPIHIKF